jgi:CRISPR/Cas system endoribonuclease Cas6 (RAMP superfamily)
LQAQAFGSADGEVGGRIVGLEARGGEREACGFIGRFDAEVKGREREQARRVVARAPLDFACDVERLPLVRRADKDLPESAR